MPAHFSARSALLIATTFLAALSSAQSSQSCYYPDGTPATKDRPCNPDPSSQSACCPGNAFCLINGLCFSAGLMTRSSCTDKTWGSSSCPQQCTSDSKSSSVALTPCSSSSGSNSYVCGLNGTDCSGSDTFSIKGGDTTIILRPDQIAVLAGSQISSQASSLASVTVTVTPDGGAVFTGGQMAGLGAGVALPLLAMLAAVVILYIREKRKYSSASLMLKLPDETKSYDQFSHKSAQSSTTIQPISPGFRSPGFGSPGMPSPGLRSPTGTVVHQNPALRSPVTDTFEAEPRSSIGSRSGTIHVSMSSPRPLPRNLQTSSWSTRSTGRDSVRSRGTASPNPQHMMSTFSERHESQKFRTRQQELEAARAAGSQEVSRKDALVQDYQRNLSKQQYAHATGLNGNPPSQLPPMPSGPVPTSPLPSLPRHELASPGQEPIIHEMGDGRKSVYQPPVEPVSGDEPLPSSSNR